MREINRDVLERSMMTFQRRTAGKIIDLVRSLSHDVRIVVGGHDSGLATEAYTDISWNEVDFIVRGEGETTFRKLLRVIAHQSGYERILGLSYRRGDRFVHNPDRPINSPEDGKIGYPALPCLAAYR